MHKRLQVRFLCLSLLTWLAAAQLAAAPPGVALLSPTSAPKSTPATDVIVLGTGGGWPLQRAGLVLDLPTNLASISLTFDFAFGTDETVVPGEFYDSFSVTLRSTDRSYVAALLTADLFGPAWSPPNPAGQAQTNLLLFEPAAVSALLNHRATRFAYTVAVELPALLFGQMGALSLSLFDNLDADASLGWVQNLSIGPGLNTPLAIESSALPNGPFAEEPGVSIDRVRRTITLRGGGQARFYRLQSAGASRIVKISREGRDLTLDYEASLPANLLLTLETTTGQRGVFRAVPEARFDLTNRTIRVDRSLVGGSLRVNGNAPASITGTQDDGPDLLLTFVVSPPVPTVESSARVPGPYALEAHVVADAARQHLRLPRGTGARFFRVRSDLSLVIRRLEQVGDDLILHYDLP
jgi:hypothetical protein